MRDLVISHDIAFDGVMANDSSWFGPADPDGDHADVNETLMAQARACDAFLVGRTTFEDMRGYWPQHLEDATVCGWSPQPRGEARRLDDPRGPRTGRHHGSARSPEDEIRALKGAEGTDIVVTGSIHLCHAPIDADLVDQYRLLT